MQAKHAGYNMQVAVTSDELVLNMKSLIRF